MPDARRADRPASAQPDACIPHSRPSLDQREIEALTSVVASGQLAHGPAVRRLEVAAASLILGAGAGADERRAAAVSSGTAALYLALLALDVGEGDEVLIPAYCCASLDRAVRLAGATPRYVDCDPTTLNPDPRDAAGKLGAATAACVVPHLFGRPADIEAFLELGPPIVEDCAQALGISCGPGPVGSRGRLAICSLYATKLVAAGEGGLVVGREAELVERVARARDADDPGDDPRAFNFKMSDLHAALGEVQLAKLPSFLRRRAELARRYIDAFEGLDVELPAVDTAENAWFRFVVRLPTATVDELIDRCERAGLACRRPVGQLVEAVRARLDELPGCREAWRSSCSVPLYPALSDATAELVVERFREAVTDLHD